MFTFRRIFAAGVGLAVMLACASVRAQVPPELTPPVARSSTDVPYPDGAEGDAAVVLELVVERDGSVSSATVVEGAEPFIEQARTAALTWRFAPAHRGGVPVVARIRARVVFHRDAEEPAGVYSDLVWRVSRRVELVPGARFALFTSSRHNEAPSTGRTRTLVSAADPRLSARVGLSSRVAWLSAFGLAHQYPSLRIGTVPAPMVSVPGFPFETRTLQTAAQASQGIDLLLPADLGLTATGFYSRFWGLTDLTASCFQHSDEMPMPGMPFVPPYVCPSNKPVSAQTYGLEVLLRRPFTKRLTGWLSYTLSRSTKRARFLTPAGTEDLANVPSEFDRTHVLNAILSYDLGRRWRVGGRLLFQTGTPYSKLEGSLAVPPYNAYRNPAFYRVDVRLEKRWRLGQDGSIAFVLEGQNATLSKEISNLGIECEEMPGQDESCKQSTIGPLTIPSVGVEAFF